MRTTTRVRKRNKLADLGWLGDAHLNWRKLGPDGWRQVVPVPSSVSGRLLWWTWNPQRRTVYTNLPGPVDTVTTYGGHAHGAVTTQGSRLVDRELEAWAVKHVTCPRPTCRAQPRQSCVTPSRVRTGCHAQRREMARAERRYGRPAATGDTTPGGRSREPGPISPLGRLVRRIVGGLLVVAVAWLVVVVLGLHSGVDVFRWEVSP
jgi:hypothetical protein